jgi:thiol-disulfide isomerase/thioredoxin
MTRFVVSLLLIAACSCLILGGCKAKGKWTGDAKDFAYQSFDGKEGRISDFAGKPLVVNFWATWCGPCVGEFPEFQKVYDNHKGAFTLLSLAVDDTNDPPGFVKSKGYTWSFGFDKEGAQLYKAEAIPMTIFITKDGTIKKTQVGGMSEAEFEAALKDIL